MQTDWGPRSDATRLDSWGSLDRYAAAFIGPLRSSFHWTLLVRFRRQPVRLFDELVVVDSLVPVDAL